MKARIRKVAGKNAPPSPVTHRPWQESVDEFDSGLSQIVDDESEEAVVDLWLEEPNSFADGLEQGRTSVRRVKTGGNGLARHDPPAKTAAWDREFADARAHAAEVLRSMR